jgi:hypothetical protein
MVLTASASSAVYGVYQDVVVLSILEDITPTLLHIVVHYRNSICEYTTMLLNARVYI